MSTIGVALAIPEPWASELQDYRESLGDATAAKIPTHITLLPPTEVAETDREKLTDHLTVAASVGDPFDVHLRGTGTFRPVSPVVFVTVAKGISQCEQLAWRIRSGPLDVALQYPYHPHVTIAHHLSDDVLDRAFHDLARFECLFEASSFHLYSHDDETGWQPRQEFRLRGTD